MTPESLYSILSEKLPALWKPHTLGAEISLGRGLTFLVTPETEGNLLTIRDMDSSGKGTWIWIHNVEEVVPTALAELITNHIVYGSSVLTHVPDWLRPEIHSRVLSLSKEIEAARSKAYNLTMLVRPPPPNKCNLHDDCEQANQRAREKGRLGADHCHDDCCEDCFGT